MVCPSGYTYSNAGDRSVSSFYIVSGILEKITYPTKGATKLEYEPNLDNGYYAAGLRVKRVYDTDENNNVVNDRSFVYSGLFGMKQTAPPTSDYAKSYNP